jgi:hypothetical protein
VVAKTIRESLIERAVDIGFRRRVSEVRAVFWAIEGYKFAGQKYEEPGPEGWGEYLAGLPQQQRARLYQDVSVRIGAKIEAGTGRVTYDVVLN